MAPIHFYKTFTNMKGYDFIFHNSLFVFLFHFYFCNAVTLGVTTLFLQHCCNLSWFTCGNQQRCLHFWLLLEDSFEQLSGIVKNVDSHEKPALFLIMTDSCLKIIQAKIEVVCRRKSVTTRRFPTSQLSDGVMFFSATQARTVFLAFVTNDIFFSVRQAVNHAALGTGLVFELPIIAGSTIPHSVEDPVVYPHGFTTLGAVFHDAMTL